MCRKKKCPCATRNAASGFSLSAPTGGHTRALGPLIAKVITIFSVVSEREKEEEEEDG